MALVIFPFPMPQTLDREEVAARVSVRIAVLLMVVACFPQWQLFNQKVKFSLVPLYVYHNMRQPSSTYEPTHT